MVTQWKITYSILQKNALIKDLIFTYYFKLVVHFTILPHNNQSLFLLLLHKFICQPVDSLGEILNSVRSSRRPSSMSSSSRVYYILTQQQYSGRFSILNVVAHLEQKRHSHDPKCLAGARVRHSRLQSSTKYSVTRNMGNSLDEFR